MQLVRTGDDAFMLVPYKVATAQAESQPAIRQLDTDEVHGAAQNLYWGKQPLQDAFERGAHWGYRRGVSAAKEAAARAPAESVLEDAARYRAFIECGQPICFMGEEYYGKAALDAAIDAAMNKGGA